MADSSFSKLHENIKTITLKALEASKPSGLFYGTVTSIAPLEIQIEQKMTLDSEFLILSSLVQNFTVNMTVDGMSRNYTVNLALKKDEKVILLRVQGGQQFLVLDRIRE